MVAQPQPGYQEVLDISQHSWMRQSTPWLQRMRFSQGRVSPETTIDRPPPSNRRPIPRPYASLDQLSTDARAGIDEKPLIPEREERRGASSLRVGRWTSRTEQNRAHLASDTSMPARRSRPVQNSPTTLPFASIS